MGVISTVAQGTPGPAQSHALAVSLTASLWASHQTSRDEEHTAAMWKRQHGHYMPPTGQCICSPAVKAYLLHGCAEEAGWPGTRSGGHDQGNKARGTWPGGHGQGHSQGTQAGRHSQLLALSYRSNKAQETPEASAAGRTRSRDKRSGPDHLGWLRALGHPSEGGKGRVGLGTQLPARDSESAVTPGACRPGPRRLPP